RPNLPALRVGRRPSGRAAADQRHRLSHILHRGRGHARERPVAVAPSTERSSVSTPVTTLSPAELQKAAREHLWLHFTRMSSYTGEEIPIIVRGDGCYLEDINGKRYLDALAGLFAVNIGYGFGDEIGEAAAAQLRELPFYTNWSYAHPRAIELAAEVASVAPGDLNRVFFVSRASTTRPVVTTCARRSRSAWRRASASSRGSRASDAGRPSLAGSRTTGRPWARSRS